MRGKIQTGENGKDYEHKSLTVGENDSVKLQSDNVIESSKSNIITEQKKKHKLLDHRYASIKKRKGSCERKGGEKVSRFET